MSKEPDTQLACNVLLSARDPLELMQAMRDDGWCVVLKCMPPTRGWIIEGSRSEYDAPSDDQVVGVGMWCCEVSDVTWPNDRYRPGTFAVHADALEAVREVYRQLSVRCG